MHLEQHVITFFLSGKLMESPDLWSPLSVTKISTPELILARTKSRGTILTSNYDRTAPQCNKTA